MTGLRWDSKSVPKVTASVRLRFGTWRLDIIGAGCKTHVKSQEKSEGRGESDALVCKLKERYSPFKGIDGTNELAPYISTRIVRQYMMRYEVWQGFCYRLEVSPPSRRVFSINLNLDF